MGFKADTSFLRFLSMGAVGVQYTISHLEGLGFRPVELERYCGSNKIWFTKVKRLRLPDLLCVNTGLRVEVRAKSDLKIRMSDAPNNPDRTWDAGLRDEDIVAFVGCSETPQGMRAIAAPVFFTIGSLRSSVRLSILGPPKSASEGAERDRTWPSVVPSANGTVLDISDTSIVAHMVSNQGKLRRQTYTLRGKIPYVVAGDSFCGRGSIIAGVVPGLANVAAYQGNSYNPMQYLATDSPIDRYAAVKALRFRDDLNQQARSALDDRLDAENEERVFLEIAGSGSALGSQKAMDSLHQVLWGEGREDLRMEAVLILTELQNTFAENELENVAASSQFTGREIRQAAIWGLGKMGLKAYDKLLPFIDDAEDDVALHAIGAFGVDTPPSVIENLISSLRKNDSRRAAAASAALCNISSYTIVDALVSALETNDGPQDWLLATLARMSFEQVNARLTNSPLLGTLSPMFLLSGELNWLLREQTRTDLNFLLRQDL